MNIPSSSNNLPQSKPIEAEVKKNSLKIVKTTDGAVDLRKKLTEAKQPNIEEESVDPAKIKKAVDKLYELNEPSDNETEEKLKQSQSVSESLKILIKDKSENYEPLDFLTEALEDKDILNGLSKKEQQFWKPWKDCEAIEYAITDALIEKLRGGVNEDQVFQQLSESLSIYQDLQPHLDNYDRLNRQSSHKLPDIPDMLFKSSDPKETGDKLKTALEAISRLKELPREIRRNEIEVTLDIINSDNPEVFLDKISTYLRALPRINQLPYQDLGLSKEHFVNDLWSDDALRAKVDRFLPVLDKAEQDGQDLWSYDLKLIWDSKNPLSIYNNYEKFHEVLDELDESPSKELRKLSYEICDLVINTPDPKAAIEKIRAVFERNNLPLVGKAFRVFEILYPTQRLDETLRHSHADLSPVLKHSDSGKRYEIIYKDLLKVQIDSANPSLYLYLKTFQEGQVVFDKARQGQPLSPEESAKLNRFLDRMDVLYASSQYGQRKEGPDTFGQDTQTRIQQISENFALKPGKSLTDRISMMFIRPLGYRSLDEVTQKMESVKNSTHYRNVDFYQNVGEVIKIEPGSLIKGVDHHYIDNILQNGSVAKEFLGSDANSDRTPFDTDTSLVLEDDANEDLRFAINKSLSSRYGDLLFVIRDRGQFQDTEEPQNPQYDPNKYELFPSRILGPRHYGIRTGIPSTEIDYMVVKDNVLKNENELNRILFTISQNGFYIPVVDMEGRVIFTPQDYAEFRVKPNEILEAFKTLEFKPQTLIETFKKSPYLTHLYEGSVGVWEGYTLDEHTLMVMNQFERYFADNFSSSLLSKDQFRLLLSIHDLGKPLAVQITGSTKDQHEYTMKFLPKILEPLNLDPKAVEVISGIASQDYIGEYMQGKISLEEASKSIKNKALDMGVSPKDLLPLLTTYFMADAGAYTEDAGGKRSLDNLFEFIREKDSFKGEMKIASSIGEKFRQLAMSI